ncbi:oxidoreductase [Spiroplasma mirum]
MPLKLASYDGVEIHGPNTYLLQQFFYPHANQRKHEWGELLKNGWNFL